jgi:ABC-2 type transport system ATP-binding protein
VATTIRPPDRERESTEGARGRRAERVPQGPPQRMRGRRAERAPQGARTDAPAVLARGLHKTFRASGTTVHAVRGLDLSVAPGETIALLGPNGAGKSTTLDMVLGLCVPDAGSVSLSGVTPAEAVRTGGIAAMLQTGSLLRDVSVRELIELIGSFYPNSRPVDDVLAAAGLESVAGQYTQKLSGGQTQRVRFAMALVTDARLLVLDEPTVGLDVEARRDFWRVIRAAAAAGKTVVFATHYLDEADANADRIILLAHGKVVAEGPATELKARIGRRSVRVTLPDVATDELLLLPGVTVAERHGEAVQLGCADSDAAVRALLSRYTQARDLEVTGAGLEQAFLELTKESE